MRYAWHVVGTIHQVRTAGSLSIRRDSVSQCAVVVNHDSRDVWKVLLTHALQPDIYICFDFFFFYYYFVFLNNVRPIVYEMATSPGA